MKLHELMYLRTWYCIWHIEGIQYNLPIIIIIIIIIAIIGDER